MDAETGEQRCEGCRFFDCWDYGDVSSIGGCLKYAPRPLLTRETDGGGYEATWPRVYGHMWCGEFEPKRGAA